MTLIEAAKQLLQYRQGILLKEYDKFSPTLAGALHDLAMAVNAEEENMKSGKDCTHPKLKIALGGGFQCVICGAFVPRLDANP